MKNRSNMKRFGNLLLCIVAILPNTVRSNDIIVKPNITLVDRYTNEYLDAEENLWAVIARREDSTLQQIYNIHMDFLQRHYGESNILFKGFLPHITLQLFNNVVTINTTSHDIAREFFEHRNYTVLSMKAFEGVDLDKTFQKVYKLTVNSTEFWQDLENSTAPDCERFASKPVQSEYQILFDYYKDIQAAALRTYITAQLSYMILHLHESGNFRNQSIVYRELFRERNADIRAVFKSKLPLANKDIWSCDPLNYHVPGFNYEITNFLQGYIDAEVNLNADGSCALTCGDYQNTKHYACHAGTLCAGLKPENRALIGCKGKVRGCHNLDDDDISVCPGDDGDGIRYKYVKSSTGLRLGNDTTCTNELTTESWTRWFVKCSICFCYCDDITDSHRTFSLREVVSNIQNNHIVTGVSLLKRNGVIQLTIAERQLNAFGHVNDTYIEYPWKLGEHFVPNDNSSRIGVDYHVLSWEKRALDLDTVIGPIGTVVTGVRFMITHNSHIQLAVRFTEYDEISGKLINLDGSFWLSNPDGGKHRINTDNLDIPTRSTKPSIPHIKENGYIRFGPTHKKIDLSQRTVPFIDGLKVEPDRPAMLSGIGLFYKRQTSGFGGFVAPKIILNFDSIIE